MAGRLFTQVWRRSPSIEMDLCSGSARIDVYIGEVFVGCAVAARHISGRGQLMLVPPSLALMGTGAATAGRIAVTGHLGTVPTRRIRITEI